MTTEECAAKAQIDSIIRKLDPDKLQTCTTATAFREDGAGIVCIDERLAALAVEVQGEGAR